MDAVSFRDLTGSSAESYERYFVPAIAAPVSVELLSSADLRTGEQVLDVGCGTGVLARQAAARVGPTGSVAGVDVAPDMLEVARSAADPAGPPIDWRHSDATDLPFPDRSFDAVLCQLTLMFVEDRPRALREMRRVLVDGGRVVVSTPGPIQPPFEHMEQAIIDHISPDLAGFVRMVFSMHDPGVLGGLLADAGFADVDTRTYACALDLPGPADFLWQYINLTPMAELVGQAPAAARDAMEAQVVETWTPFVRAGRTPVDQPMVIATGTRS